MTAPNFWEVLDRAVNTGPLMTPRDFDLNIWKAASRLVKEYDIKYDPKTFVSSDDSLADDVWKAGLELFNEVGMYCMNSGRVIKFDESETKAGLNEVRGEIEIGEGGEKRILTRRNIGDKKPPMIIGGVIESDMPEGENFVKLYQTISQDPLIDGLYAGPPLHTVEGRTLRSGSPLEVHMGVCTATWVREAIRRAGRPGLHFISACPSAVADIAACNPQTGVRRSDALAIAVTSDLKTDYEALGKVAFSLDYGCVRNSYGASSIGGWAGGVEGTMMVAIADMMAAVIVYQHRIGYAYGGHGYTRNPGAVPVRTKNPGMWGTEICGQAIARNSKILNGRFFMTAAGPGTEMQFWEIAALGISGAASGRDVFLHGPRRYKVKPMLGSPLENRFHAEIGRAAAGLTRENANELLKQIVPKYQDKITEDGGPWGFTFDEIYDLRTLTPRKKFLEIYERVKKELEDLGLEFNY